MKCHSILDTIDVEDTEDITAEDINSAVLTPNLTPYFFRQQFETFGMNLAPCNGAHRPEVYSNHHLLNIYYLTYISPYKIKLF